MSHKSMNENERRSKNALFWQHGSFDFGSHKQTMACTCSLYNHDDYKSSFMSGSDSVALAFTVSSLKGINLSGNWQTNLEDLKSLDDSSCDNCRNSIQHHILFLLNDNNFFIILASLSYCHCGGSSFCCKPKHVSCKQCPSVCLLLWHPQCNTFKRSQENPPTLFLNTFVDVEQRHCNDHQRMHWPPSLQW